MVQPRRSPAAGKEPIGGADCLHAVLVAVVIGAAPVPGECGSPARAVVAAHADARGLDDAWAYRYLWVPLDAGKERDELLVAFLVRLNMVSAAPTLYRPVMVRPDLIRIDVRGLWWDRKDTFRLLVWERLADFDHVFHMRARALKDVDIPSVWPGGVYDGAWADRTAKDTRVVKAGRTFAYPNVTLPQKEWNDLRAMTYSEAPVVDALWWYTYASINIHLPTNEDVGIGYYSWLGVKNADDFFKLVGVDPVETSKRFDELRGVAPYSRVGALGRQIGRFGKREMLWVTFDAKKVRRNLPLDNLRVGEFKDNAREYIGAKSNGMWATFLSDNKGVKQDTAPDFIGPDDSPFRLAATKGHYKNNDGRIHDDISCIRCHWAGASRGIMPIDDYMRSAYGFGSGLAFADKYKDNLEELRSQYLREVDFPIKTDREYLEYHLRQLTASKLHPKGLTMAVAGAMMARTFDRYVTLEYDLKVFARRLGTTEKAFGEAIDIHASGRGQADQVLAGLRKGQKFPYYYMEELYPLASVVLHRIAPPEVVDKKVLIKGYEGGRK